MGVSSEGLLGFFEEEFGLDGQEIRSDTPLFSDGLLDSYSVISLVSYLETNGGISVENEEVKLENLDSIDRILAYVRSKTGQTTG